MTKFDDKMNSNSENNCNRDEYSNEIPIRLDIFNSNQNKFKSDFLASSEAIVKYGELVVIGYNGHILQSQYESNDELSANDQASCVVLNDRRKSKFTLKRRDKANGVKPSKSHNCKSNKEINDLMKHDVHSVSYTLSRNHTVIVQYVADEKTDMFQIGRSSESSIDFIVLDTPSPKNNENNGKSNAKLTQMNNIQSTISRFACRICIDRYPPYTARIYAAGFDTSKHIFLGEKATKWRNKDGHLDGVTTNGVLIMNPTNGFSTQSSPGEWMEVSVCGSVFKLSEARSVPLNSIDNSDSSNILNDGALIDLCGATLLWRTVDGLKKTPTKHYIEMIIENLNKSKPQCIVTYNTLVFPSPSTALFDENIKYRNDRRQSKCYQFEEIDRTPMVYLECGHVYGPHDWSKKTDSEIDKRDCPICRKPSPYVKLHIGLESSIYCDDVNDQLSEPYAFIPCAHMATKNTCDYWSKITIPKGGGHGVLSMCPFCAVPLSKDRPYIKLLFQKNQ